MPKSENTERIESPASHSPGAPPTPSSDKTFIKVNVDRDILITNKDSLVRQPKCVFVNAFNEGSASKFAEDMTKAEDTGQSVIPIYIDSYGGACDALLHMIDVVQSCCVPVATIAIGKAMSCGVLLLSAGTEGHRYMGSNSRVMIHEISAGTYGKLHEITADHEEFKRLNKQLFTTMANNTGHADDYFLDLINKKGHSDWFLTATECKKLNIVNHIRLPKFNIDVNVETKFG